MAGLASAWFAAILVTSAHFAPDRPQPAWFRNWIKGPDIGHEPPGLLKTWHEVMFFPRIAIWLASEPRYDVDGHPMFPPALAEGQHVVGGMPHDNAAIARWTEILNRHFPPGSSAAAMTAVLRQQKFTIQPQKHRAYYSWGNMVCAFDLWVDWREDGQHHVAAISGGSSSACL